MFLLVINCGSSSIKFALLQMEHETVRLSGIVEAIGEAKSTIILRQHEHKHEEDKVEITIADHTVALEHVLAFLSQHSNNLHMLAGIGHRVVHGGDYFHSATLINDQVIDAVEKNIPLAPLHNPANLVGIKTMAKFRPELPQVAVFDTAFFQTLPAYAYRYAVPQAWYEDHHVRRYGFHGTSHQHVAQATADYLDRSLDTLNLITLHLGNGSSAAAIKNGICIDTSMGMTPLEGLVMGSRCGDIDPALPFYLVRNSNMDIHQVEAMLNESSGLKGLCGVKDMRAIQHLAEDGDHQAKLAIDLYCYRICKYIGAYHVALGGTDALIFTGGIGENSQQIRHTICAQLKVLGIEIDAQKNDSKMNNAVEISTTNSAVKVLVIPTNEELEIARQSFAVIHDQHRLLSTGK